MVLPIGFFAPLPLAIMIPFMAAQSFAMGQAFGTSFQYGKRKISSMSNEEFNKYTPLQAHEEIQADIRAMIPSLNKSFQRMESFQIDIINSMVDTIKLGLDELGKWIAGGFGVNPETSTSAITLGEGGSSSAPPITEIQGGSRQDTPGSYIPNLQSYEDWLKEAGFDTTPPKKIVKKTIKTIPVPYTYNPRRASAPRPPTLAYAKAEGNRIVKNIGNLNARIWNNKVHAKLLQRGVDIRGRKHSLSATPLQKLHDLRNQLLDLTKKLRNEFVQYKNLKAMRI